MKKLILSIMALLAVASLGAQEIRDVDVTVDVHADGSAHITQVWDVTVVSGTEWYIPIENLGPMSVSNLKVSENGFQYKSLEDNWDSNVSRQDKYNKCGIIRKSNGVELCWGQGEYGDHVWTAEFDVEGLVQGMTDYDGFNFMFVNDKLVAAPSHAKVTIRNCTGGQEWNDEIVKVWAFGYSGDVFVIDGAIVAETDRPMSSSNHMIVMARFDKGLLTPEVTRDYSFSKLEKKAKKGSDYKKKLSDEAIGWILALIGGALLVGWYSIQKATGNVYSKNIFGTRKIQGWVRDVPFPGELFPAFYIIHNGDRFTKGSHNQNLIGAFFLKWVLEGKVTPVQDPKNERRLNLAMKTDVGFIDTVEMDLYEMALAAAGDNLILESKEFEKWSERNYEYICKWPDKAEMAGRTSLSRMGLISGGHVLQSAQAKAQDVVKFKNFLSEFTLLNERGTAEVALWNDYLIYAQLYGIADKVADQLKKLFPKDFSNYAQSYNMTTDTFTRTIYMNSMMSRSVYNSASSANYDAHRASGGGGRASFGGGGGFSGGGHGGGSR